MNTIYKHDTSTQKYFATRAEAEQRASEESGWLWIEAYKIMVLGENGGPDVPNYIVMGAHSMQPPRVLCDDGFFR